MFKRLAAFGVLLTAFAPTALASSSVLTRASDTTDTVCPSPYPYATRDLAARAASALDFSSSEWIYTNEVTTPRGNAPLGSRALRKTFVAPEGKTPEYATIMFSTDNAGVLFVNGNQIAENNLPGFGAGTYCVKLQSCLNVFAVNVTNIGGPAGLLFAAQITYTDGTTTNIVSDTTWRANPGGIPGGFEQLSFDDNTWPAAIAQGLFPTAPWGNVPIAGENAISFTDAAWIWTDELSAGTSGNAPPGARAFRKTISLPSGYTTASVTAIITVDNSYSLYVNGVFVGTGTDFTVAQRYTITNVQGPTVVIAIYAVNTLDVVNPAGVLASFEVTSSNPTFSCVSNCTSTTLFSTDSSWKFNRGTPAGFQLTSFDDSTWPNAIQEGADGVQPWGTIAVPTATSAPGSPLDGAPASA